MTTFVSESEPRPTRVDGDQSMRPLKGGTQMNAQLRDSIQLLGVKELAGLLKVSVRSVWRLRSAGKLPEPIKIGRSVRWLEQDIVQYLDGLKGETRYAA